MGLTGSRVMKSWALNLVRKWDYSEIGEGGEAIQSMLGWALSREEVGRGRDNEFGAGTDTIHEEVRAFFAFSPRLACSKEPTRTSFVLPYSQILVHCKGPRLLRLFEHRAEGMFPILRCGPFARGAGGVGMEITPRPSGASRRGDARSPAPPPARGRTRCPPSSVPRSRSGRDSALAKLRGVSA